MNVIRDTRQSGYKNLVLWQEARNLTVLTYNLTDKLPKSEEFGLKIQMRKASVSVMSQIAEGSLLELESQAEVVKAVKYWSLKDFEKFNNQRTKVGYLLYRYKKRIN
jgi:hypothetical protein